MRNSFTTIFSVAGQCAPDLEPKVVGSEVKVNFYFRTYTTRYVSWTMKCHAAAEVSVTVEN